MGDKQIITIGRELGSGGREIGKRLAKELDIPYYDKELLAEAAKKSGYSEAVFEMHDEKPTNSFLYALAMGVTNYGLNYQRPLVLELYLAQFDTMRKLAEEGGGVFIGRCADDDKIIRLISSSFMQIWPSGRDVSWNGRISAGKKPKPYAGAAIRTVRIIIIIILITTGVTAVSTISQSIPESSVSIKLLRS